MSALRPRRGRPVTSSAPNHALAPTATVTLVSVTALLMIFSMIAWVLDNATLAAMAGTAACGLAIDIGRRLLSVGGRDQSHQGADSSRSPDGPAPDADDKPRAGSR